MFCIWLQSTNWTLTTLSRSTPLAILHLDRQEQTLASAPMYSARQLAHVYLRSCVGLLRFCYVVGEGYACHQTAAISVRSSSPASFTPTPDPLSQSLHSQNSFGPTGSGSVYLKMECDGCHGSTSHAPTEEGPSFFLSNIRIESYIGNARISSFSLQFSAHRINLRTFFMW